MINLALTAQDERIKAVCGFGVLDRAGIRPQEYAEVIEEMKAEQKPSNFDPCDYIAEELNTIEAGFRIIAQRRAEKAKAVETWVDSESGLANPGD